MDRETAREMLRDRADIKKATARYPDAELNRYLNEANRALHSVHARYGMIRDESLYTIPVDGSATYALPTGHFKTLSVFYDNGSGHPYYMRKHSYRERPHGATDAHSGHAHTYRIAKTAGLKTIELYPRPTSGLYFIAYIPELADLTADTDELVSHLGYDDDYIITHAAIKCLRKEGSPTTDLRNDLNDVVANIVEDAQSEEEGELHRVRDTRVRNTGIPSALAAKYAGLDEY